MKKNASMCTVVSGDSNTLGKHQLKDLGKLAHKTWTASGVLHVACRMSTRLLRNILVFFWRLGIEVHD